MFVMPCTCDTESSDRRIVGSLESEMDCIKEQRKVKLDNIDKEINTGMQINRG